LFGERAAYPRDIFEDYSGIDPDALDGLFAARAFVGNERMGWKVAYCERDVAIYAVMLLFGLMYSIPAVQARLRPLPWLAYLAIGLGPIALDGFSQLFSQLPPDLGLFGVRPFAWIPYRESTPFLRTLTGGLFGLANGWLAFPYIRSSAQEIENDLTAKLTRAGVI
jgi:hypothetical protein